MGFAKVTTIVGCVALISAASYWVFKETADVRKAEANKSFAEREKERQEEDMQINLLRSTYI
jgi:hypothetical protein